MIVLSSQEWGDRQVCLITCLAGEPTVCLGNTPPLLHQPLAEPFDALQALLDVGHAGGVAEADVIVGAEGDAGDGGDFLGFEQPGAEVGGLEAGLGNVREEVERALGVDAA